MSAELFSEEITNSTHKASQWGFTAFEGQWKLFEGGCPPGIAEWGWQTEICPTTQTPHYQGWIRTAQQLRRSQLSQIIPRVKLYAARNWQALKNYCSKSATAVPGTKVHETNNISNHYQYAKEVARKLYELEGDAYKNWTLDEALLSVDTVVRGDISEGNLSASWLASNPAWLAMWRKYWKEYITGASRQTDRQTTEIIIPPAIITPDASQNEPQAQPAQEDQEDFVQTWE